jgi:hypothetical protein
MMCALGYGDVGGSLLACAARGKKGSGSVFPGVPPEAAARGAATTRDGPAATGQSGYPGAAAGRLVQDSADIWARAVREGAAAFERGIGRARTQNRPRS